MRASTRCRQHSQEALSGGAAINDRRGEWPHGKKAKRPQRKVQWREEPDEKDFDPPVGDFL
jgi:hypothetical protein